VLPELTLAEMASLLARQAPSVEGEQLKLNFARWARRPKETLPPELRRWLAVQLMAAVVEVDQLVDWQLEGA
jgi:hypothetical protein